MIMEERIEKIKEALGKMASVLESLNNRVEENRQEIEKLKQAKEE